MTTTPTARPSRLVRLVLGGCVLGATCVVSTVSPAHADDELGLSRDATHWSDELTTPLFDADLSWVPGDVRSAHFFVRNQASELGRLSVAVRRSTNDRLIDADDLEIEVRAGAGEWTSVGSDGPRQIPGADELATDRPVQVSVRATYDPLASNRSMLDGADITFLVRLTDARVVEAASGASGSVVDESTSGLAAVAPIAAGGDRPADRTSAFLPATGNTVDEGYVWIGFVLVGAGAFLAMRRRHQVEERHDG